MSRAYERVNFRGHTLNRRTVAMIQQAEDILGYELHISQGSYNGGAGKVSASAGTHDGGGAVDISWPSNSRTKALAVQKALREVGFASWVRDDLPGVWTHHIHSIAIKDLQMSSGAANQVVQYYGGYDGLAGHYVAGHYTHTRDKSYRPNPIPVFSYPLKTVDLSNLRAIATSKKKEGVRPGVKVVQNALNAKLGTHLKPDGVWGPKTREAYASFEKGIGGDGDGIPASFSLERLGWARFRVVK